MAYEYLVWAISLLAIWLILYIFFPILRKQMMWSSIIFLPFGFFQYLWLKTYWNPMTTLFNLHEKIGLDIESFIWVFAVGGIVAVVYEVVSKRRAVKKRKCCTMKKCLCRHSHYHLLLTAILAYFVLITFFKQTHFLSAIIASYLAGMMIFITRKDLRRHVVIGGLVFFAVYVALLFFVNALFPHWFHRAYTLTIPVFAWGVPIEEILAGLGFGLMWSAMYEAIRGDEIKEMG